MGLEAREVDAAAFRDALGSFASSVNIITMWEAPDRPLGMTATAFASVSVDPLLVLVCINRSTRTYFHVAESGRFGVNVLSSVGREVSDYCARPGVDKSLRPEWLVSRSEFHCPALAGALAFLDCRVEQDVQAGTHAVFIGAVEGIGLSHAVGENEPLLHFRGAYRQLRSLAGDRRPQPLPIILEDSR